MLEADDKDPWPTLGREVLGIDDERIDEIAEVCKLLEGDTEEFAVMRTQEPDHILDKDGSRCSVLLSQLPQDFDEAVERTRVLAGQTLEIARE
jgi:hypothetical protein